MLKDILTIGLFVYIIAWCINLSICILTIFSAIKEKKKLNIGEFIAFSIFITFAPISLPIFLIQMIYRKIKYGVWFQ
jgi:hypothetical protein